VDAPAPGSPPGGAAAGTVAGTAAALVDVLMPQMGTSMVEGTLVGWRHAPGDAVQRDAILCDVSTDKVDVECPAPATGVLDEILVAEGETVDVGTVIARLRTAAATDGPDDTPPPARRDAAADQPDGAPDRREIPADPHDAPPVPRETPPDRREALRRSSPVAARLAADHGLDVRVLSGSGRGGRVTKRDVLEAVAAAERPMHTESPYRPDPTIPVAGGPPTGAADPETGAAILPAHAGASPADAVVPGAAPVPADLGGTPEPVSRMRRSIGAAVRRSLDTAAHCTTVVECDMSRVERERRELGLTALPLLARHAIDALRAFPALNATFDGETIVRYGDRVHLGIAVSLGDDGLIAPVIHDAQDLTPVGLARRIKDVAARARAGRLSPDEVRGGTFTITNPGAAGALMATPVINAPQVAILDLEAIVRRPVVVTDAEGGESIGIRPMVHLCMGWDHRALDGLYAARFLTDLRRRVEG
jgi:pyruvate/2-oxoglutarate dehydrogenase complex dihydrolipoamide acyltransferase (E2) component